MPGANVVLRKKNPTKPIVYKGLLLKYDYFFKKWYKLNYPRNDTVKVSFILYFTLVKNIDNYYL